MSEQVMTADAVLAWFDTPDARRQATRLASQWGLGGYDGLAENVLHDARVAMWKRSRSDTPLEVDSPGGYGTRVLRTVTRELAQGRARRPDELPLEIEQPDPPPLDVTAGDGLRTVIERLSDSKAWLTSAALTYLTLSMHPDAEPDFTPRPKAGARPDQARCWPALWFAGVRDVLPDRGEDTDDHAARRRRRARRIDEVLDRVQAARVMYVSGMDRADG